MKNAPSLALSLVAALVLAACGGSSSPSGGSQPATASGPVVAKVGDRVFTLGELDAQLETQPITRSRLINQERKREFVDNLIRFELLAQEAKRQGLDKDPDVQEATKRAMVQKLTQTRFSDEEAPVTEEEARAFYQEHIHDYVKPERVRASHIFFEAPRGDVNRNRVRAEAERSLAELRRKEAERDRTAFSQLAKTRSDDGSSKRAGGDLSFRTEEELSEMWGADVAKAAFALSNVGDFAPLIETDRGFHVLKLTGRQAALDRPFESVRNQIENRLSREKMTQAFEDFVASLEDKTQIMVDEEVLEQLEGGIKPVQGLPLGGASRPDAVPSGQQAQPIPAKAD